MAMVVDVVAWLTLGAILAMMAWAEVTWRRMKPCKRQRPSR